MVYYQPMSTESLHRTPEIVKTQITNEGILEQKIYQDIRPKRTCIKDLNKKLIENQKKIKLKTPYLFALSSSLLEFLVLFLVKL